MIQTDEKAVVAWLACRVQHSLDSLAGGHYLVCAHFDPRRKKKTWKDKAGMHHTTTKNTYRKFPCVLKHPGTSVSPTAVG